MKTHGTTCVSGENSHLLLSILVKHLDHKNVVKQSEMQTDIVEVASELAKNAKQQASVAIIGAINDLVKHLRKCMVHLDEASSPKDCSDERKQNLQLALENCISQLSNKVSEGPHCDLGGTSTILTNKFQFWYRDITQLNIHIIHIFPSFKVIKTLYVFQLVI